VCIQESKPLTSTNQSNVHEKYTYMDYFRMLTPCFVTCVIINSIFHTCTFKIYI